jgi:hypothetical protein
MARPHGAFFRVAARGSNFLDKVGDIDVHALEPARRCGKGKLASCNPIITTKSTPNSSSFLQQKLGRD